MMLEGQNYAPYDGQPKSGAKNFINTLSNKYNVLMGQTFKEAVKKIAENPNCIGDHPLSVQAYYKKNEADIQAKLDTFYADEVKKL